MYRAEKSVRYVGFAMKKEFSKVVNYTAAEYGLKQASPFWFLSGINYAAFCALTLYPFIADLLFPHGRPLFFRLY